jgi:hypothetical protein
MYDIGVEISFQPYLIRENNECINLGKVIDTIKKKSFTWEEILMIRFQTKNEVKIEIVNNKI